MTYWNCNRWRPTLERDEPSSATKELCRCCRIYRRLQRSRCSHKAVGQQRLRIKFLIAAKNALDIGLVKPYCKSLGIHRVTGQHPLL